MEFQGFIEGGWGFVAGAYGITWTAILIYLVSLYRRRPE